MMNGGTMFETKPTLRTSAFDRPSTVRTSLTSSFDIANSAWGNDRGIWNNDGTATRTTEDTTRPNVLRQGSSSSIKFGRGPSNVPLSPLDNPRGSNHNSTTGWAPTVNRAADTNARTKLTSPTKQSQSSWLFNHQPELDVENSSLLTGSAPENEYFDAMAPRNNNFSSARTSYEDRTLSLNSIDKSTSFSASNAQRFPMSSLQTTSSGAAMTASKSSSNTHLPGNWQQGRQFMSSVSTTRSSTNRAFGRTTSSRDEPITISPTESRFQSSKFDSSINAGLAGPRTPNEDIDFSLSSLALSQKPAAMVHQYHAHNLSYDQSSLANERPYNMNRQLADSRYSANGAAPSFEPSHIHTPSGNLHSMWAYAEPEAISPFANEYKNTFSSPYYSATDTPPTGPESIRSAGGSGMSSRTSHHDIALVDRKLRNLDLYQQYQQTPPNGYLPVPSTTYDLSMHASNMRMNPLAPSYHVANGLTFQCGYASNLRMPPREPDQPQVIRSPLLEEFRMSNKTNKRYELRDIFNHVVEFSGDQHGSRFIQQKLETANSDEKDQIFREIQPNSLQLMTDVFGNYVIQKLFEHGNQSQKKVLANNMRGHIWTLSMQMYGCRVVQKALEHVLTDQQASMVKELDGPNKQVLKVIRDQNGNHVVQKAIERVPAEHIQFIIEAHKGEVVKLATHTYGCRVIQRILEFCEPVAKRVILDELHGCVGPLITDSFGNYVVQHVIQNGEPDDRRRVVTIVQQQLLIFSKHKFASNVVEKCIEYADDDQRAEVVRKLIGHNEQGQTPVLGLLRDQYGNYVIQRIHSVLRGTEFEALNNEMKHCFPQLKRTSYGKQVMAIEKLLYGGSAPQSATSINSRESSFSNSHGNGNPGDFAGGNQLMPINQIQPTGPRGCLLDG